MPWIVWLYLVYFTILWSSGVLWGQDEDTAARAVVIVVVSLHFVAGGLFALMRGVSAALRERYLHPSVFMLNVLADSLLFGALVLAALSGRMTLYIASGLAVVGNSFCLAGYLRTRAKQLRATIDGVDVSIFFSGDKFVFVEAKNTSSNAVKIHLHDPVSEEHVSVFKDSEPHALLQGSLPPNSSRVEKRTLTKNPPDLSVLQLRLHVDGQKKDKTSMLQKVGRKSILSIV